MKTEKLDLQLFKALYLIVAGIIVTQILDLDRITSTLFLLTFPMTVVLWLRTVRKMIAGSDLLMLAAAATALVSVLLDIGINDANISFDYLKKLIMFIMSLLFLQTAHRTRIDRSFTVFINRLVDVLTLFFIFMYFARFTQMHMINGRLSAYLTFRFTNSNLTGLFLICLYMLQVYRLFTPERWYQKLVHITMAVMMAVFVIQTQSRNCLLAMALFTAASAWLIFRGGWNLRITKFWAVMIALVPVLFIGVYMMIFNAEWVKKVFAFLVGEGKGLDARVKVWTPGLQAVWESPLIGAYCRISEGTGMSQLHNSHLDIAASYGVPVLVIVMILLSRYLHQGGKVYIGKSDFLYMLGFACAILLGIGEAALYSGGLGIYVFIGAFLLLANRDTEPLAEKA
nr:O-antigen ligase family protein [Oscillospiraceae bacterium]